MDIYIASSWKNQHAVEMLTWFLREKGHKVRSFIENNHGEFKLGIDFEQWIKTDKAKQSFEFDTDAARFSDLVIYIGPSGTDTWAEIGVAWSNGVPIIGLYAKGEQSGLMRKMINWFHNFYDLLKAVEEY